MNFKTLQAAVLGGQDKYLTSDKFHFNTEVRHFSKSCFLCFVCFVSSDMRKDQKCAGTRIDDDKMSTFSHVMWIKV